MTRPHPAPIEAMLDPADADGLPADGDGLRADGAHGLDALEVANRLRPVLLRLARELRRETHALGVTSGQVHILAHIRDHAGIGVVELAAREQISAPSMSNHLDRLEAAGMVLRRKETGETGDRRRVGLSITTHGLRALAAVRSRRTAWLASRLRALGAEDLARVDAAAGALLTLLEDRAW